MEKKRYIPVAVSLLVLAGLLGLGGTQAYLTYQKRITNRFQVGYNEITVTEEYDPPDEIVPGEETQFRKAVQVRNTGTVPCYVRVRLEYSDSGMKKYCTNVLGDSSAGAEEWETMAEILTDGKWVYGTGGCYYYTEILEAGEETPLLLEKVRVQVPEADSGKLKDFEIYVFAESIQTLVHEPGKDGEETAREALDYHEAWEQFLDPAMERSAL